LSIPRHLFDETEELSTLIQELVRLIGSKGLILVIGVTEGSTIITLDMSNSDALLLADHFLKGNLRQLRIISVTLMDLPPELPKCVPTIYDGWTSNNEAETLWGFSSDAQFAVAAGAGVTVWKCESGEVLSTWKEKAWVMAIAFGPGDLMATGLDDGQIRLSEWKDQNLLRIFATSRPVSAIAFSPDGKRLASASEDRRIQLWDIESGNSLGEEFAHSDRIASIVWHPDGSQLYSAGWDRTIRAWDVSPTGKIKPRLIAQETMLPGGIANIQTMKISGNGALLASTDKDYSVYLRDAGSLEALVLMRPFPETIDDIAFSPDSRILAVTSGHTVRFFEPSGSAIGNIEAETGIEAIAFTADGGCVFVSNPDRERADTAGQKVATTRYSHSSQQ
jgi:WD40 repeat protein